VERLILDVNGFDAIVFTKIESIVVLDFEFGGQWDIGVKRSRFAWDLEIKILAGFDDIAFPGFGTFHNQCDLWFV